MKLYRLNEEGGWGDMGTGHVTIQYAGADVVMEVRSELDGE